MNFNSQVSETVLLLKVYFRFDRICFRMTLNETFGSPEGDLAPIPLPYLEPPCSRHKGQLVPVKVGGLWGDTSQINTLIFPVPQRPRGGCPTTEPVRPRIKTVEDPAEFSADLAAHWGHEGSFSFTQREFISHTSGLTGTHPITVCSPRSFFHLKTRVYSFSSMLAIFNFTSGLTGNGLF